jgi:GntR family transcriptional regulator
LRLFIALRDHFQAMPTAHTLQRSPGTSLHRQLFMVLREQILSGVYGAGMPIPKEDELCDRFNVSRITVRRAVADLEQQGLLIRQQGKGTFVRADMPSPRASVSLGLVDSLKKTAGETDVEVLVVEHAPAPGAVAQSLGLTPGKPAVHATRLRKAGAVPLMVTDAWVPERVGKGITATALKKKALYELLMAQGVKFGRVVQEISAVSASPLFAGLLQAELGSPLLKLTRVLYDQDGEPVQHLTVHATPERSRILVDLSADTINSLTTGQFFHDVGGGTARTSKRPE